MSDKHRGLKSAAHVDQQDAMSKIVKKSSQCHGPVLATSDLNFLLLESPKPIEQTGRQMAGLQQNRPS
jgi:hypothetical protein